jgi:hypothetical protein
LEKGFKDEKIIVTPYGVDLIDFFPKTKIDKTFRFIANRDIQPNEEIFVWYGDINYWNDGRSNTNVI